MKNNKGFTLVELLAVIVILAIIMIIAIPAVLNTLESARRKTFGEYITKVYDVATKKYLSDELLGNSSDYVRYDITKDLDLNNTGDYKGYVVITKNTDSMNVYIGISDKNYHTATKLGDDDSSIVNYINYTFGGEPIFVSPLEKYNGSSNSFTNGEITDFNLPSKENKNELKPIYSPTSSEAAELIKQTNFERECKDFIKAAYNDYKSKGLSSATYKYSDLFGENDLKTGAISIDINEGIVIGNIQYMNEDYHTFNKYSYFDESNREEATTIYNSFIIENDDVYFKTNYVTKVEAIDYDQLEYNFVEYYLKDHPSSENPTEEEKAKAELESAKYAFDHSNRYISNDYNDGYIREQYNSLR